MLLVPRTCVRQPDAKGEPSEPTPLSDTRAFTSYVLLGDPGLGKSEAFGYEANIGGGRRISASDFLALDHPELKDSAMPVFIDGLDETRAGTVDGRVPLDNIRKKLQQLGCRSFRLSCRATDWLGNSDASRLESLLPPGQKIQVFTLQPLTLADVAEILPANHGVSDPQAFIASAAQHGLTGLLFNPQTLGMLATAVGPDNTWPETRLAVYQMACDRLVHEHNEEHIAATRKTAPNEAQLHRAAGYLCAIQLIADLAGFTHSPTPPDRVIRLNTVPNPEGLPLDEALASRLFKSVGLDVFAPTHRTVAEFLAARCLAGRLQEKLTLRRLLALICGSDGGIVSSMRGLSGWLASMSAAVRTTFTRLDSLGVLLYGDAKHFSIAEKSALMGRLGGDIAASASFRWYEHAGRPFAALVTPEMLPAVQLRLADTDPSENNQLLVLALLEGLLHAQPDIGLTSLLLSVIRDASRSPAARRRALKVYLGWVGVNDPSLRALLDDVGSGVVSDSDDEILGALLQAMYPRALSSADLPTFLHSPKKETLIGKYTMFWRHDLDRLRIADVPDLLDAFAARVDLHKADRQREYAKAVSGLLTRALKDDADKIPDERLLNWLDAACGKHTGSLLEKDDKQVIQQWLQSHPDRYFSLLDLALTRYAGNKNPVWQAQVCLHGAKAPANEAEWWLVKAQGMAEETQAKEYFLQALHAIPKEPSPGLEEMLIACENLAALRGWRELLVGGLTSSFEHWNWKREEAAYRQERERESAERRASYRARLADFALPLVPLDILEVVADLYEHRHYEVDGDTPRERLANLFAGDDELVQAALAALRRTIGRNDLPSAEETLAVVAEGKLPVLNAPALISLELTYLQDHAFLDSLSDDRLVAALVAHLVRSVDDHDTWVAAAVVSRPNCMAKALSGYFTAAMRWKTRSPDNAYLFRIEAFAEVARECLFPLLAQFPLRMRPHLRNAFRDMLQAALTLPTRDELLPLILARVDAPEVDGPQRACWLAAGLVLKPDHYLPLASCYLQRRAPAARDMASFLHYCHEVGGDGIARPPSLLGVLIEHFAKRCMPAKLNASGVMNPEMDRVDLVKHYINDLAARPDAESAEELKRLESLPTLAEWGVKLREARAAQRVVRRDATYERPMWPQVCAALQQGAPANPAEIAAVLNDTIEDLKEQISRSDLNLNLDYWNADHHKKATKPRHEELCRNTFADQLRARLARFEVDCMPEVHHIDGKRSDVWCTIGPLGGVPIEVKLDRHKELWTATRGQLMARYAADPRAKGHGVYIVLWLGESTQIPLPPTGTRPQTPAELQTMLEAVLSEEEKRSITIHVLDCSVRSEK